MCARRQRTIRVWVSSGPRVTVVPALIGQTERTARLRLDEDALEVGTLSEFRSPDYPADAVVAQDPPPDAVAPKVSLLLNRGEQAVTYVMPDVIGMNGDRAAEALRSRGFRVAITGSQPYTGVPPGTVVRQQPAGGFRRRPGRCNRAGGQPMTPRLGPDRTRSLARGKSRLHHPFCPRTSRRSDAISRPLNAAAPI